VQQSAAKSVEPEPLEAIPAVFLSTTMCNQFGLAKTFTKY
jgi:hypothetical protein